MVRWNTEKHNVGTRTTGPIPTVRVFVRVKLNRRETTQKPRTYLFTVHKCIPHRKRSRQYKTVVAWLGSRRNGPRCGSSTAPAYLKLRLASVTRMVETIPLRVRPLTFRMETPTRPPSHNQKRENIHSGYTYTGIYYIHTPTQ